jgi:uncharacterized repeat protein (TIGR03803 family)
VSRNRAFAAKCFLACTLALVVCLPLAGAQAATFRVLYNFLDLPDGSYTSGGVVADSAGDLYGAAFGGAKPCRCGTIFKLAPDGSETALASFKAASNGYGPGPLIADKAGNLYGTTYQGGDACADPGCGVVFKFTAGGKESVLYSFKGGSDGFYPHGRLIADRAGNLYGTTLLGGGGRCDNGCGTAFKLTPDGRESLIHTFCTQADCPDGSYPDAGLTADRAGDFYGTTVRGGAHGFGTVFTLAPDGSETVLYSFKGGWDGAHPFAGVVADGHGNLYGTTWQGGGTGCQLGLGCGTVFKVTREGTETVLHSFLGGHDGSYPVAGLAVDGHDNIYGTASLGGSTGCDGLGCGIVFKLAASGAETILYSFADNGDGAFPSAGLLLKNGILYGTAYGSGRPSCTSGCGTVFALKE